MKIVTIVCSTVLVLLSACQESTPKPTIEALSVNKAFDESAAPNAICRTFTITKDKVSLFFQLATEVSSAEFHGEAIILPCKYEGTIRIDKQHYQWIIHAGGAGYLFDDRGTNKRFICKNDCCNKIKELC